MSRTPLIALAALAACSGQRAATRPAPACCLAEGLRVAERYRVAEIRERRFTQDQLWRAVEPSLRSDRLRAEEIGRSVQGRPIRAVTFGRGPTTVLMWSQMHGDESTATMALADVLAWVADAAPDPLRDRVLGALTVTVVPMLNPDGAELFQRENAVGVDVNRDARRLATPEARALKGLRDRVRPDFAFNLHDQGARTLVGPGGRQAAIALLAPPAGPDRAYAPIRARARLVAAGLVAALEREIPGRIAKYDDSFNRRAFGDLMQQWGASTVLIESGALPDDPQKQRLRAVNVAALLTALDAIATGAWEGADPALYDRLPFNNRIAADVVVRGARLVFPGQPPIPLDIALTYDDPVALTGPRLREAGDLDDVAALDTVDAAGLFIHPEPQMLTARGAGTWLRLGAPALFTLRRGAEPESEVVRRFEGPRIPAAGARQPD